MVIFQFATLNYQRVLVLSLKQKNSVQFISNSPKESMRPEHVTQVLFNFVTVRPSLDGGL